MQLALTIEFGHDDQLIFAQQLGVDHVIGAVEKWDVDTLKALRNRVEKTGLELAGIENLPQILYRKAMFGLPGRDGDIEEVCQAIRNIGAAGIPLVGYRWSPPATGRPERLPQGRGEGLVSTYDQSWVQEVAPELEDPVSAATMWENLVYFLARVAPAAEQAGVRLACHPDDPPVPTLGGVAQILHDLEGLKRLLQIAPGPWHGLDLCVGTLAAMPEVDPIAAIGELGRGAKIFMVHLRNLCGKAPEFREAFVDEGDVDVPQVLQALKRTGFDGLIRTARPPGMVEDTAWGHKGHAFDLGYLQGVLQAVN